MFSYFFLFFLRREKLVIIRFFFFRAEDGIRDPLVTGVQTCALPISLVPAPDGEGFQVFVVDSGSVAHARSVAVGGRSESTVEILSGLQAGEIVVTSGAYGVADG